MENVAADLLRQGHIRSVETALFFFSVYPLYPVFPSFDVANQIAAARFQNKLQCGTMIEPTKTNASVARPGREQTAKRGLFIA